LARHKFSPRYGFDIENDMINKFTTAANTAYPAGLVVQPDNNGVLAAADSLGYFLMQEVTVDGPSLLEIVRGDWQWEVKAGDEPVSVILGKQGQVVRTELVARGNAQPAPAVGGLCNIAAGYFETNANGTAAKIVATPTETGITGVYDVEIL
jgi:hypothetical protein